MQSSRHADADVRADVAEEVDAKTDLGLQEDRTVPQNHPTTSSPPSRGKWTPLHAECLRLAVLVVCMLVFLVVSMYWGQGLWDAIDGYPSEQHLISLPHDAGDDCCDL